MKRLQATIAGLPTMKHRETLLAAGAVAVPGRYFGVLAILLGQILHEGRDLTNAMARIPENWRASPLSLRFTT